MICRHCGTQLPDDARFCAECGAPVEVQVGPMPQHAPAPATPPRSFFVQNRLPVPPDGYYELANAPADAGALPAADVAGAPVPVPVATSAGDAPLERDGRRRSHRTVGIVVGVCATLLLLACIGAGVALATLVARGGIGAATCPVTFSIVIDGFNEDSSRIPVRITGTDEDGNEVDKTIFLAHSGVDTELAEGDYKAEVLCTPIASDGSLYDVQEGIVYFSPSADEARDDGDYVVDDPFVLYRLDDERMTRELADEALRWARKDEESGVNVGKLEEALNSRLAKLGQGETQDEGQVEVPAVPEGESEAEPQGETPAEPQPEAQPEAPAEPQPEAQAEPQPEAPAEPQPEAPAEPQPEPQPEAPAA